MRKPEAKRILLILTLVVITFVITMVFYGVLGFAFAWVLEKGLNAEVNYDVFVYSGLAFGFIKSLIGLLTSSKD